MNGRLLTRGLLGPAIALLVATTAIAQEAQPQRLRLAYTRVKNGGGPSYLEAQKIINAAYKKAGAPFREVWVATIFGDASLRVSVSPVTNYAQFDGPSPMAGLTEGQRNQVTAFTRESVESTRYTLVEAVPAISIRSERSEPARFARITLARALPGKGPELEALIKNTVLPAWKAAGAKDVWVYRSLLGGPSGEYTVVQLFDKWAELDAFPGGEKLLGSAYTKYLAGVAATIADAETLVMQRNADASFLGGN